MNGIDPAVQEKLQAGRLGIGTLGVKVPEDYAAYVGLGRFRRALVLAEQKLQPTEALTEFVKGYGLVEYGGY